VLKTQETKKKLLSSKYHFSDACVENFVYKPLKQRLCFRINASIFTASLSSLYLRASHHCSRRESLGCLGNNATARHLQQQRWAVSPSFGFRLFDFIQFGLTARDSASGFYV